MTVPTLADTKFQPNEPENIRRPKLQRILDHLIAAELVTLDDVIAALTHLTPAADQIIYWTSPAAAAMTPLTAFARTILDDPDQATVRTTIGAQQSDTTLTALAAYNTNGILVQTAADTFAGRTLTAPAAGFTITNPAGTAGNPTFALANDLAAVEGLAGTGIAVRTAADTWATRTITGPAAGISVTNGDGIAGNPTLALTNDLSALETLAGTGIARRTGTDTWSVGTTVSVAEGGTGLATATLGDLVYGSGSNTRAILAGNITTTKKFLTQTGNGTVSAAPAWGTIAISDINGLGTGVATALAVNVGSTGAFVTFNGAGGTPSSLTLTNATGLPLTTGVTGILPGANGGTGNGFFAVSGPATSLKTFTLPNASATILTDNAAVTAAQGGTGIASYAIGDILYASGSTTLSKLADVATGNVLISGGVTSAPLWGKVGLTTHVSGTLGTGNGGTGVTSLGNITKTDDTNVTLTLGGTPTGAVVTSTSFTLGWTGTLSVARGGLGFGTTTQGDILYADAANSLAKLAKNTTATRYLANTGTNNNPAWDQVNLANGVTGQLPAANVVTGTSGAAIPLLNGANTHSGNVSFTADLRHSGAVGQARFETTSTSAPVGAAGAGIEIGAPGGACRILAYNRTSLAFAALEINASAIKLSCSSGLPGNYANDAAAQTGGINVGEIYRNGSVLMIRVT